MAMAQPQTFKREHFQFGLWSISADKSRILGSDGPDRHSFESQLQLPHVPDMIFAQNSLRLVNGSGSGIEFTALDALKSVDTQHDTVQVANAKQWKEARAGCEYIDKVVHPFDWTFTTDYAGTLLGDVKVQHSQERIDIERLKVRDKILFYADVELYEDELHDCGCSMLSVKIRVMPTYFFVLMRFYMRVDNVIVRVNDTRLFHEVGTDYILREFTSKESAISDLKVPYSVIVEPNDIAEHLTIKAERFEKLLLKATTVQEDK